MSTLHKPVLLNEVIAYLRVKSNGIYVDGTFGLGGHSRPILEKLSEGKLIALEWDKKEVDLARQNPFFIRPNFYLINDNFANLALHLQHLNIEKIDGFLLDLGLSSYQLNYPDKGLSFRAEAPLNMRFNPTGNLTAEQVINNYSAEALADIFYHYGEERKSRLIARKIGERRKKMPITTTQQLVSVIASCFSRKSNKHPARKVFQALRIVVNNELENLKSVLKSVLEHLAPGGRVVVISYHSLEDRIVKQIFKECSDDKERFRLITKKPLIPTFEEITVNNRSRSAKMRVIERL